MSVEHQLKAFLKSISHQELIEFVQKNANNDAKFRNLFLSTFNHLNQDHSKEFYQKKVRSILETATGKDGWIEWTELSHVKIAIAPYLVNANKYIINQKFDNAFHISTALAEEMTEALQYADDSNGDIGYFVESAMNLIRKIAHEKIDENLRQQIFTYCISAFKKGLFKGWDWHLDLISIAVDLTDNEKDAETLVHCLEFVSSEYETEMSQLFKLNLIKRFKTKKEVDAFINAHISNTSIRTNEIENAFKNNDFERVIQLAKDGIKCNEKDKPGLVKDWYNWLLKVAQQQNDNPKIIEYARYLFIDNFNPKKDYYKILKQTVKPNDWHEFLEQIIEENTPKKSWYYSEFNRKIFINEKWWDRLYLMVKENCSLENIQSNEMYLVDEYKNELLEMYEKRLIIYVEKFIGRNHYSTACNYIGRMKKIGGNDQAEKLIKLFRNKYPQRKALIDELNKI